MAEPLVLPSSVRDVSVFREGAVVTRIATLPSTALPDEVSLDGLPLALDDESVRVSVRGDGAKLPKPSDVRVALVVPAVGESMQPPSDKEVRDASDEVARIRARIARLDRELGRTDRVALSLAEPFEKRPPRPAPAAAWTGFLDWAFRFKRERIEEKHRVLDELMRAEEALAKLKRRDALARAQRDSRQDAVRKRVVVRLREGEASPSASLHVEYRVPGARWVPTYVFRMGRDGRSATLQVRALVVQSSGEPWERVKLSVSTADLLRDAELPELKSLRIGRKQPEPPKRAWRDPPSGLDALFEGLDSALETQAPPPPPAPPSGGVATTTPRPPEPQPDVGADIDQVLSGLDGDADDGVVSGKKQDRERRAPKMKALAKEAAPPKPMNRPSPPPPMSMPAGAPMPPMAAAAPVMARGGFGDAARRTAGPADRGEMEKSEMSLDEGDGYGGEASLERREGKTGALRPEPSLLRFSDLVMAGWRDDEYERGKLRAMTVADRLVGLDPSAAPAVAQKLEEAEDAASEAAHVGFPDGTLDVSSSSGAYDHRYDAEGLVDVPSDGQIHNVPLFARSAPAATTLVVVPRESTQAVRVAAMRNPLEAPLLAGPADIYLEDEFLVASPIRTVPAGADLRIGLGVEEALKVARNTFYEESAHGLLSGGATLAHRVEIEIANRLASAVKVEVRERVPIRDEKDESIEIAVGEANPAWEDYDQAETSRIKGGHRWTVTLGAGESRKLQYGYTLKIDAKNEVVGGNRRE